MTSLEDTKPTLEDTKPTKTPATLEVSDERFLSECFKHIQGIPTVSFSLQSHRPGIIATASHE